MIFVAETEERSLLVFPDEASAVASCEGLDVEAAIWLFWSEGGLPLEASFITPNRRGWFSAVNGTYALVAATPDHHAPLVEALDEILYLQPNPYFSSINDVRTHLASSSRDSQNGT